LSFTKEDQRSPESSRQNGAGTTGTGRVRSQSGLRYRPIIALGHGGMADVLLSVGSGPSRFHKLVVLKTMRKELVGDPELREMFLAEARLSARLNHANVVQVFEVVDTALPCIIMEYLEGQPMSALLHVGGERFTTPHALRVISDALAGLHYSHELRDYDGTPLDIVHRDVSPQNIFITYDGVVKVLDFGIAKAADVSPNTRTGIIKGKLNYMPREQLLGEKVDRRADVYAVGGMLWQAASGVKPWRDKSEGEVMRALIDGAIPRPSVHRPVDPKLEEIVMKALAPNPADRYATAQDLRLAIDQYLAEAYPASSIHEVGELVSRLFNDEREARKEQIRAALSAPLSEPPPPIPEGLEAIVSDGSASRSGALPVAPRRQMTWALVIAASVAAIAVLGVIVLLMGRNAHLYDALMRSGSAAAPTQIQVRLAATPLAAAFDIDGKPLAGNPAALLLPSDGNEHEVRATLAGYEPVVKRMRFDRDFSLEISLQPVPETVASAVALPADSASSQSTKDHAGGHKTIHTTTGGTRKPTPNCEQPFYYENGIKVYKPECI
jgi:eukaryotic-like serine/threonine-protein kinase